MASASREGSRITIFVRRDDTESMSRASSVPETRSYKSGIVRNTSFFRRLAARASSLFRSWSPDDDSVENFRANFNFLKPARSAPSSNRVSCRSSTDQESFEFPNVELAELVLSLVNAKLKDTNYEGQTESTEQWMHAKLKTLQYDKSKFGYFLPGEDECDSDFMPQLFSVSRQQTFKPGTDSRMLPRQSARA